MLGQKEMVALDIEEMTKKNAAGTPTHDTHTTRHAHDTTRHRLTTCAYVLLGWLIGGNEEEDELDSFMRGLSSDMSKKEQRKKEDLLKSLTEEIARVERLIEVRVL
jgi:hypothetical protein